MPGEAFLQRHQTMSRAGTEAEVGSEGEREHQKREIYAVITLVPHRSRGHERQREGKRRKGGQRVHLTHDRTFFMDSLEQLLPVNLTHETWSQQ